LASVVHRGWRHAECDLVNTGRGSSWADGLELVGDDDRLVGFAEVLPLRLLAELTGLSAAMARRGFDPVYDRGQIWSTWP
jgi:hypothetical protein